MYNDEFPNCCGIMILSDFGYTNQTMGNSSLRNNIQTPEQIEEQIKKALEEYKSWGIVLIAINEEQKKPLEPIFTKLGFKLVSKGLNSAHNAYVYLYSYEFHEYVPDPDWSDDYDDGWDDLEVLEDLEP